MRVHVVPDQREQPVRQLSRVVRRRVERQHSIDEIDRSRLLAQLLAAAVELHVRLLELLDRRCNRRLYRVGSSLGATRLLCRLGQLSLQSYSAGRIGPFARRHTRRREPPLEIGEAMLVFAVHPLRYVLESPDRVFTRVALEKANERQLEQRDRRKESFGGSGAEQLSRLVQHDEGAEAALVSKSAHREPTRFAERL
jgi:hypothetical protein